MKIRLLKVKKEIKKISNSKEKKKTIFKYK